MRTFSQFNDANGSVCPICKTARQEPLVLIPIPGTEKDNIAEAQQYHMDCVYWFMLHLAKEAMTP